MKTLPEFHPGSNAETAHESLRTSLEILDTAQHCAVLWFGEIMHRKLYRDLGFSTMRAYAMERLEFSSTRAGDFMRLAAKLQELPVLRDELESGRLGYSKAMAIVPVADANNEAQWVEVAKVKSRAEVRDEVRRARLRISGEKKDNPAQTELMPRPAAPAPTAVIPVAVGFTLSPGQFARYEAVLGKIDHRGDKAELLLAMAEALLVADSVSEEPPEVARRRAIAAPQYQVHVHQCPECARKSVSTPAGDVELGAVEGEVACCDAEVHNPGERNTTTIPPKMRREVQARDRYRCRRKGCGHTRYLHVHHVVPRADGGSNEAENLVTLCSACHDLWHRRGGELSGMLSEVVVEGGYSVFGDK